MNLSACEHLKLVANDRFILHGSYLDNLSRSEAVEYLSRLHDVLSHRVEAMLDDIDIPGLSLIDHIHLVDCQLDLVK